MSDSPTVLVIDDEPLVRLSLVAYLQDHGFACLEAADGLEGLEAFERFRPDLVITDAGMPRLDGFGVASALRERSPGTPVILLSGTGETELAERALELGAAACLNKPMRDMKAFVTLIHALLGTNPS